MGDPDRELAGKARSGDRQALESLYERHKGPLLGFLTRTLGKQPLAEDVFQETWMKVMNQIKRFDSNKGRFKSWLFRIGANAAIDRIRREGIRKGPELDAPVSHDGENGLRRIDLVESTEPGPAQVGDSLILGEALDQALGNLPPFQRAAILLRHQQGMSTREVSESLGIPQGTVKSMIHRGFRTLRRDLSQWKTT